MVIPQGHDQNDALLQSTVHATHTSFVEECGSILCLGNPICAVLVTDGAVLVAIHSVCWMFDGLSVLGVELLDL